MLPVFVLSLFLTTSFRIHSPEPGDVLKKGYYVVVAAYKPGQEEYVENFLGKINHGSNHADFGLDARRNLVLVYLEYFADYNESIKNMLQIRSNGEFPDAWVRIIKDDLEENVNLLSQKEEVKPKNDLQAEPKKETEPVTETPTAKSVKPVPESQVAQTPAPKAVEEKSDEEEIIDNPPPDPVIPPQLLSNTPVFLSLYNARNNKVVEGEIDVVDTERKRLITSVKGNDYLTLPDPKSNSGELTLVCNAFGYRPIQHQMNYKRTEGDTLKDYIDLVGNYYMVKFDLVRIHKGDISTLFNVYFYNDAAIMLPESQFQLNSLLDMMEENPQYRIRLHGHTNGGAKGRIITMGPSKSFFALADDVKEGFGSAKALSEARASIIKEWLVTQGISEHRIEIKAWGGKRMIHDKHSVNAKKNVRVDVELISE